MNTATVPDLVLRSAHITNLYLQHPEAANLPVRDARTLAVDDAGEYKRTPETKAIDLCGRRVVPGLSDSHLYVTRDRFAGFWGSGCDCFAF